jgi:hypothetical protein
VLRSSMQQSTRTDQQLSQNLVKFQLDEETPRGTKQCTGKLPLLGREELELRETQRAVSPFGELVVFFEFLRQVGYGEAVRQHLPFRLTSLNAIDPVDTFTR